MDAFYAVHKYCKYHTGDMMPLWKNCYNNFARKKKIQGQIYMEDELIGTYDALLQEIWYKYFIEAQGYTMENNIFNQYKKSAIILEVNSKFSRPKRTNHIKTRYLFIKYMIEQGSVEVVYFTIIDVV